MDSQAVADDPLYFEDLDPDGVWTFGEERLTREEIVDFAEQYDPQPFHVDPEAAKASFFGELVASGWHTAAMTMRMIVDEYISEHDTVLGAIGVDELRWSNHTKPGYSLHVESEMVDKEPWQPGIGVVKTRTRTVNEDGTEVMSMVSSVLYRARGEE